MKWKKTGFFAVSLWIVLLLGGCRNSGTVLFSADSSLSDDRIQSEQVSEEASTEIPDKNGEFYSAGNLEASAQEILPEAVSTEEAEQICIYICGAVRSPGVYYLDDGARLYQAVEAAGGLTEDAELTLANQARFLSDEEQIIIYTQKELEEGKVPKKSSESSGALSEYGENARVNLNTAGIAQLCTLSGIGEQRAADIIAYRNEHGSFGSIEDIMKVAGIKEAVYSRIKDKITVE